MRIHKGDTIKIISGKDIGKTGKIMRVLPSENKVVVEGANVFKKHQRPKRKGEKGEIVNVPRPLSASNAMLVCPNCKMPARIGYRFDNDKKFRFCKKCQASI